MRYLMKSGVLSNPKSGTAHAKVKNSFLGATKTIILPEDETTYLTDIDITDAPSGKSGDVRYRTYTLKDTDGTLFMEAHPGYAKDDAPDIVGWPICRAPKVDHAAIVLDGAEYQLLMHNSQNYSMLDSDGKALVQIMHKGISGGWTIETNLDISAWTLCGLFIFCRYIEQENEFIVV